MKTIVFDIDGTLLTTNGVLSPSTRRALSVTSSKGNRVILATGRNPVQLEPLIRDLHVSDYITLNGGYVMSENQLIHSESFSKEEVIALLRLAKTCGHDIVFATPKRYIASSRSEKVKRLFSRVEIVTCEEMDQVEPNWFYLVHQVILFVTKQEEELYKELKNFTHSYRFHPETIDLLPKQTSKLDAVKRICERLGVEQDDVIAFGNGVNDIELLRWANVGVAMGNSPEEVKMAGNIITETNDREGIYIAMQQLGLI